MECFILRGNRPPNLLTNAVGSDQPHQQRLGNPRPSPPAETTTFLLWLDFLAPAPTPVLVLQALWLLVNDARSQSTLFSAGWIHTHPQLAVHANCTSSHQNGHTAWHPDFSSVLLPPSPPPPSPPPPVPRPERKPKRHRSVLTLASRACKQPKFSFAVMPPPPPPPQRPRSRSRLQHPASGLADAVSGLRRCSCHRCFWSRLILAPPAVVADGPGSRGSRPRTGADRGRCRGCLRRTAPPSSSTRPIVAGAPGFSHNPNTLSRPTASFK